MLESARHAFRIFFCAPVPLGSWSLLPAGPDIHLRSQAPKSCHRRSRLLSVRKTCHFFSPPVKFWTSVTGWMAVSPTGIDVRIRWPSAEIS